MTPQQKAHLRDLAQHAGDYMGMLDSYMRELLDDPEVTPEDIHAVTSRYGISVLHLEGAK